MAVKTKFPADKINDIRPVFIILPAFFLTQFYEVLYDSYQSND